MGASQVISNRAPRIRFGPANWVGSKKGCDSDIVNYLACGIMPCEFSYQQKRKLRTDCRLYIWDDPLLYRRGVDMIIRRCVLETE